MGKNDPGRICQTKVIKRNLMLVFTNSELDKTTMTKYLI